MIELPPRSAPRAELIAALADLARCIAGSYDANTCNDVLLWIDDVEASLQGREPPGRTPRETVAACSNCGRPGHNKTTCTEPDRVAKLLAPTAHKTPPTIAVPVSGDLVDDASRAVLGIGKGARWK